MVKLKLERNIDILSLKYVQELWEQFAEEFDIPFLTAVIDSILSGSLIITWLVPPDIAEKIVSSAHKSTTFFQKYHTKLSAMLLSMMSLFMTQYWPYNTMSYSLYCVLHIQCLSTI